LSFNGIFRCLTVILYDNLRLLKRIVFFSFLVFNNPLFSQTKTSTGSGNWNVAGTWNPAGVPGVNDDVLITGNHVVDIVSNSSCRSLTVGAGGTAQLRFNNNINRSLTVSGNIVVAANAELRIGLSNSTHSLIAGGDITNNGTIDFYQNVNRSVSLVLNRNGNQSISGNGILTELNAIQLQMGASFDNVADFSTSSFVVQSDFLRITNGTFKYSTASAINITPVTGAVTIPANGGIWMNSPLSIMSLPANIIVSGKLSTSGGTMNIGNAANENLLYSGGTFSFTGGVTNVAGRFDANIFLISTCTFNMSGGNFNVATFGSTNTLGAPFQIGLLCPFNMSGGTIVIDREGGSGATDLGYANLSLIATVSGGTVQIGSATTPAAQVMKINSLVPLPNLLINSANATASLATAITVNNTVRINSGILNSNNLGVTLGGDWENNGGTFTAGSAIVTFSSNAAQSIFRSGGENFNHLLFSGSGVKTFSSPVIAAGNFSVSSGSSVDVSAASHQLSIAKNFVNSGTFNSQSGTVLFNGTTLQNVGGNSVTSFFNMTLGNAGGLTLSQAENLIGTLSLNAGTFNTNLQIFTMVSTATATARIAQIAIGADISGVVTVQRFVPGGSTGWALWGTPISSALSFADWDDNIAISCPTCPDGYVPNFTSIYSYSEPVGGSYSNTAAYFPMNTINDPIVSNTGYWVYVGDGQINSNPITVDVAGTVRKGNQVIPLTRTVTGPVADDGWNLIHNPYPSPISWTALRNGNANVDDAIYCYNADLNGGTGGSASYVNGVSSPAVGAGGIGDNIPMSQGFYVHATNNTNLTALESHKTAVNTAYLRTMQQNTQHLLRIAFTGGVQNFYEECVAYTDAASTNGFDSATDAFKLAGQDYLAPYLAIQSGTDALQINGIPVTGTYTTDLKTVTGYNGIYTLSAVENSFPIGTCINLYDKFTNSSTDLANSTYTFDLSDTTTIARFVLTITHTTLQVNSNVTQPNCTMVNSGEIAVIGTNAGPWNYYWKDFAGNPIKTSLSRSASDTLKNLSIGGFYLDVTTVGGCDNSHTYYTIDQKISAQANFSCVDTSYLNLGAISFSNTSVNTITHSWDFGDGSSLSTVVSPQHNYLSAGNYIVQLISESSTACLDTVSRGIYISDKVVGLKNLQAERDIKLLTLSNDHFIIEQELNASCNLSYQLRDAQGKTLTEQRSTTVNHISIDLDLSSYAKGIYFLTVVRDHAPLVIKLPVLD
jgi:PKD repeat protein